jgi:glycosyltransferase involved in cell wall biosynthesis
LKTTLIITTYNWPQALDKVLLSVYQQSYVPDQIVIADDGSSGIITRRVVSDWGENLKLIHAWQPDDEFRAARARNLAALANRSDHLIFIDGDCILPAKFIENHRSMIKRGLLVSGGRYMMTKQQTITFLTQSETAIEEGFNSFKFASLPLGFLRDLSSKNWRLVKTCNFAILSDDFFRLGGFDEDYAGWGLEDSDFVVRAMNNNFRIRNGRFALCVAHLFHRDSGKLPSQNNRSIFKRVLSDQSVVLPQKSVLNQS